MYRNVRKKPAVNPPMTWVPHRSILKWSQPSLSLKSSILQLHLSYLFKRRRHRCQRIRNIEIMLLRKVSHPIQKKNLTSVKTPSVSRGSFLIRNIAKLVGVRLDSSVLVVHVQKNSIRVLIALTNHLCSINCAIDAKTDFIVIKPAFGERYSKTFRSWINPEWWNSWLKTKFIPACRHLDVNPKLNIYSRNIKTQDIIKNISTSQLSLYLPVKTALVIYFCWF